MRLSSMSCNPFAISHCIVAAESGIRGRTTESWIAGANVARALLNLIDRPFWGPFGNLAGRREQVISRHHDVCALAMARVIIEPTHLTPWIVEEDGRASTVWRRKEFATTSRKSEQTGVLQRLHAS